MTSARIFRGTRKQANGSADEVHCAIYQPSPEPGQEHWTCLVHSPFLFETDKKIAGVDAAQAMELAETFLRELLAHQGVTIEEVTDT
jgi:hypothetical protein